MTITSRVLAAMAGLCMLLGAGLAARAAAPPDTRHDHYQAAAPAAHAPRRHAAHHAHHRRPAHHGARHVAHRGHVRHQVAADTRHDFRPIPGCSDCSGRAPGILGAIFEGLAEAVGSMPRVAVYDIAAQRVTLPDGRVLEAHSGLGRYKDNPAGTRLKSIGPTPPGAYALRPREALFHGVAALRLVPLDETAMHGRDGILAHTCMMTGCQSQGCASFPDYGEFLRAFRRGQVTHLVVVPARG